MQGNQLPTMQWLWRTIVSYCWCLVVVGLVFYGPSTHFGVLLLLLCFEQVRDGWAILYFSSTISNVLSFERRLTWLKYCSFGCQTPTVVSYCRGRPRLVLVNRLECLSLPRNRTTIDWPARHDLVVDWAVKPQHKQTEHFRSFRARSVNLVTLSWASHLGSLPLLSTDSFASNWQLPSLNQRKGENGKNVHRKVQGVPHHKPQPTPDTKRKKKMTKTNAYKTKKQMHDKQRDQLPLPQVRWSQC